MSTAGPRLPKTLDADSLCSGLLEQLAANARPLWSQSPLLVPSVIAQDEWKTALRSASQSGFIVRGLEAAERRLAEEQRGLSLVEKEPRETGVRISRLLLVANDGAERFYRNVEALLKRHGPRLYAIRLELDEHDLGELLFGADRVARLVLVDHKSAVAAVFQAIARVEVRLSRVR